MNAERHPRVAAAALLAMVLALPAAHAARAQAVDAEPNDSCAAAQHVATPALPTSLTGSLDTPPQDPDIDWFRFTAEPGALLTLQLEGASPSPLLYPLVGLFNSSCTWMGETTPPAHRAAFTVPPDGVFFVAVSSEPDYDYTGQGYFAGGYRLTLDVDRVAKSLGGQIVDAATGTPLSGVTVTLTRCTGYDCGGVQGTVYTDEAGRFLFTSGEYPLFGPLRVGEYYLQLERFDYEPLEPPTIVLAEGEEKDLGAGQDFDLGDLRLHSFPVRFQAVQGCESVPASGGECRFTVRVTNGMPSPLHGDTWTIVTANDFGAGTTVSFQTDPAHPVNLAPGASFTISSRFDVPPEVTDYTYVCARSFVSRRPKALSVLGAYDLFCLYKQPGGFARVPEERKREAAEAARGERILRRPAP